MNLAGKRTFPPAREESLKELQTLLPRAPSEYFEFLRKTNGAEIWFDDVNFAADELDVIRLATAEEMIAAHSGGWPTTQLPNFITIGSDAGGTLIGYDFSSPSVSALVAYLPGTEGRTRLALSLTELAANYTLFPTQ